MTMSNESIDLPEGWTSVKFFELAKQNSNSIKRGPFGSAIKKEFFVSSGYKVYEQKNAIYNDCNLGSYYIDEAKFIELQDFQVQAGDIIVSCSGTVGKISVLPETAEKGIINQALLKISLDQRIVHTNYFIYLFNSDFFQNIFLGNTRGSAMQNIASVKALKQAELLLPPIAEQKRIVAKIEELRSRTQKAREALEVIPRLCDRFRQSVLAAAFRGDLTADWREENPDVEPAEALLERFRKERYDRWKSERISKGKKPDPAQYKKPKPVDSSERPTLPIQWTWATVEELAETSLGKMLDQGKEKKGQSFHYLRNINVRWNHIDTTDLLQMYFEEDELERYSVKFGDILICEGGEPGRAAVWTGNSDAFKYQKALHRVRPFLPLESLWLIYHLKFEAGTGALEQYFTGTTIRHFTGVALARYSVRLPSLAEQKEIILRIQKLFAIIDRIQHQYEASARRLEKLDRAILTKAFRGELVPQDPNDEPASVLLERIREERSKNNNKPIQRKR
ncbi:restriction endonuclease subunit S [Pseudanabaenaceae cyanobacterium LEGE 13415]|nr:restriction endonuclease subunit S [Pseudanabaenaceae cyanobacterium LEGE 13415]